MPPREWLIRLEDILEAIERIETSLEHLSYEDFENNQDKIDAAIRNLTVIGEAANHIPTKVREDLHSVPWTKVVDLRNFVVHEYFGITLPVIWKTIQNRLPELKEEVLKITKKKNHLKISRSVNSLKSSSKPKPKKIIHPWRLCPPGQHWVSTHPLHIPASHAHPQGLLTTRRGHCANNPSKKDQLYPDEMAEMAHQNFNNAKNKPCPIDLGFKARGDKYDEVISGWTQYWNEVFQPSEPLEPNIVKALIASESSFNPTLLARKTNSNSARGLTQITNATRKVLADENGELKDHFINLTKEDLNEPNNNICAGIRWLFHKKILAAHKLGRDATWEEAVAEYKGTLNDLLSGKPRARELMDRFNDYLEKLKKCKTK